MYAGQQPVACGVAGKVGHLGQAFPRRGVVPHDVGAVLGIARGAPFRDQRRDEVARGQEIGKDLLLGAGQRQHRVIGGHELGRPLERVGVAGHVEGGGRRHLADQRRMHHVAEVDDAHDARRVVGRDQHVVEVVVVVDHLGPQRCQARQHVRREARHEGLGQCALLAVHEAVELCAQPVRRGDVPQQLMRRARMREALQRAVQAGEAGAHGAPLRGGAHGLADLDAVQVGQHAHACLDALGERDRVVRVACRVSARRAAPAGSGDVRAMWSSAAIWKSTTAGDSDGLLILRT